MDHVLRELQSKGTTKEQKKTGVGIDNFSFVVPGVVAGSAFPKGAPEELATELQRIGGIKTVVNLTEVSHPAAEDLRGKFGVNCVHIPIKDFDRPSMEQMKQVADLVMDEEARPVLLHCRAGIGRTGTMLAVAVAKLSKEGQIDISSTEGSSEASRAALPSGLGPQIDYVKARRRSALEVDSQVEAAKEYIASLE